MYNVEVIEVKPRVSGALRAFASVRVNELGGIVIHGISVFEKDRGPWISLPSRSVESKNGGKPKWYPIIEVGDELKAAISEAVLAEYAGMGAAPKEVDERPMPF